MKSFLRKNVLITGAGSGLGRLMALGFAERGAVVVVTDVDGEAAQRTARDITERGGQAVAHVLDVSSPESARATRSFTRDAVGRIDALVNNAGIVQGGPFEEVPLERHLATYRVNIEGMVITTHTFFDDLAASLDGHVVNIASASGLIGLPFGTSYASSKWAVIGFSESLRIELAERGLSRLHVTTVCPSYIGTGMFEGVAAPRFMPFLKPDAIVAKILAGISQDAEFVKEPFAVKTLEVVRAVLPRKVFEDGSRRLGVYASMVSWKGRTPA